MRSLVLHLILITILLIHPCRGGVGDLFGNMYGYLFKSPDKENCDNEWIPKDMNKFQRLVQSHLFGQPFIEDTVAAAVAHHLKSDSPKHALAMTFHGWPGIGKNYVSNFLAESIFKKGTESKFYKYYNGRVHFPKISDLHKHQEKVSQEVTEILGQCKTALFVFDEVDMMPPKLLDVLYPFLDYQDKANGVDSRHAIFIFLTNRGGSDISLKALELWRNGVKRENYDLMDFYDIVLTAAFNENGGLQHCDNINGHLISFFIPFLPMELSHVIQCINAEFQRRGKSHLVEKYREIVLKQVVFTSKDSISGGLYATFGCKNIDTLVGTIIELDSYQRSKERFQEL